MFSNGKGLLGMNMNPQTARGLQAAGLAMSQLSAGRPVNLAPLHQQMLDEQNAAKMQEAIGPALENMPPQMRAVLANMPPALASEYIMRHMMQKPAASPIAGLEARARAGGLQPGTPEYQQFMLTGGKPVAGDGGPEYGLTPQYGVTEDGTIQLIQLSKDGNAKVVDLPEGVAISRGLEKVDEGTHFQWYNAMTGEPVGGPISKNLAETAGSTEAGKTGIEMGNKAWASYGNMLDSIGTIDTAISALDDGARSGAVDRFLPNITTASAQLETAMNEMGLDVISAVTFGALSEKELRLAMETAVPRNLDEPQLRQWLVEKREANANAAAMLRDAAAFLSTPGNTLQDWIAQNENAIPEAPQADVVPGSFEEFAKDPSAIAAAEKYGVSLEEMWAVKNGGE